MNYIIIIFALVATGIAAAVIYKRKARRKLLEEFRSRWGKAFKKELPFEKIAFYHNQLAGGNKKSATTCLDSEGIRDLNLHELFTNLDRTTSLCGQQYLYHHLLSPGREPAQRQRWDKAAAFFTRENEVREKIQLALAGLKKRESYHLPGLLLNPPGDKPPAALAYPFLNLALVVSVAAGFLSPPLFLLVPLLFVINMALHYFFKKKYRGFMASFKSLTKLFSTATKLSGLPLPWQDAAELQRTLKAVRPLQKHLEIISFEPDHSSDVAMMAALGIEYFKILFLLDLQAFYSSLKHIRRLGKELHELFRVIGFTDSAIALASFRAGLPAYCVPEFTETAKQLQVTGLYHPLVEECIPNSLKVAGRGILITGSNMSGKTTFIRSLAVGTLLAQAFATCPAESYRAPFLNIYSSIVITDELTSGKSYYFKELERILGLVRRSEGEQACLFIIDECFKGTNTLERIAAAREVLAYLNRGSHIVLIATHDIELSQLLTDKYELYHFNEVIEAETLSFDYKIKPGLLQSRNAIKLLELSGYPPEIVSGARKIADSIAFTGHPALQTKEGKG